MVNEITDITETTGTAWPTPTFDAAGNMTVAPRPLSLGSSYDLKYDAWNRLIEVKNTGGSVVATYRYDGATRRVSKNDGTNTRYYYYSDQWQVLEERLAPSSSADRWYVWGVRSIDDLVLRHRSTERLYTLNDAMTSVTAVVSTAGAVQERYGYNGFGAVRFMTPAFGASTSSYAWETLFDGYRYDSDTGLYQVRYRYLHPLLGRWASRDPIGEIDGVNIYALAANIPINQIDEYGLFFCRPADPCKTACDNAYRMLNGVEQANLVGLTICCNGKKKPCVFKPGGVTGAMDTQAVDIISSCIRIHEMEHVAESWQCPDETGVSIPTHRSEYEANRYECAALRKGKECLQRGFLKCNTQECIKEVRSEIRSTNQALRTRVC